MQTKNTCHIVTQQKRKGFTLIELLVVVLIIGILAAIALPMYTKTVNKVRATEALSTARAVAKAVDRAILGAGGLDACWNESGTNHCYDYPNIDIELPLQDCSQEAMENCLENKHFRISWGSNDTIIVDPKNGADWSFQIYTAYFDNESGDADQKWYNSKTYCIGSMCPSLGAKDCDKPWNEHGCFIY